MKGGQKCSLFFVVQCQKYLALGAAISYTQLAMQDRRELIKAIVAGVGELIKAENEI